jgi:hypothetical protein
MSQLSAQPISLLAPRPKAALRVSDSRALERALAESRRAVREWRQRYEDLLSSAHEVIPLSFTPVYGVRTVHVTIRRVHHPDLLPIADDEE